MLTIKQCHQATCEFIQSLSQHYQTEVKCDKPTYDKIWKALKLGKGYPIALTVYPSNTHKGLMLETISVNELIDSAMPQIKFPATGRFLLIGEDL